MSANWSSGSISSVLSGAGREEYRRSNDQIDYQLPAPLDRPPELRQLGEAVVWQIVMGNFASATVSGKSAGRPISA
jgi:hypothetical protein